MGDTFRFAEIDHLDVRFQLWPSSAENFARSSRRSLPAATKMCAVWLVRLWSWWPMSAKTAQQPKRLPWRFTMKPKIGCSLWKS